MIHDELGSYRSTGWQGTLGMIVGLVLMTAALIAAVTFATRFDGGSGMIPTITLFGGGIVLAFLLIGVMIWRSNASARHLADMLETQGFTPNLKPKAQDAADVMTLLAPLVLFEQGQSVVHWYAYRNTKQRSAIVAQHSTLRGSGKYTRAHYRTVVALPLHARGPAGIWLRQAKGHLDRLSPTKDPTDLRTGDDAFDRRFLVQAPADPSAPARVLTDEVRRLLLAGPRGESWALTPEYVCCSFGNDVGAKGLRTMLNRARRMAELCGVR